MDKVLKYECKICDSITTIWGEKYFNMDYVKLNCCSIFCKKKYIIEILEKNKNLPTDINKIIIQF
jgi:hypothetical protein